jgi:hypothetical protein
LERDDVYIHFCDGTPHTIIYSGATPRLDEQIQNLRQVRSIVALGFEGMEVTNDLLFHISRMSALQRLSLDRCRLNCDDDLGTLIVLPSLRELSFSETNITDDALFHIKKVERLERLCLNGTKITDLGLNYIAEMPRLTHIWLGYTQISDTGLKHLEELAQLGWIDLDGTKVSNEAISMLRVALPTTRIIKASSKSKATTGESGHDKRWDADRGN